MNCRSVIKEISCYLDGDLDTKLKETIEQHLGACEDCQILVDTTKKTIQIYCNSTPLPLPDDVRTRLHTALFTHLRREKV